MAFSVNLLTSPGQCDALMTSKQRERTALLNRLSNLTYQLTNWNDATSAEAELSSTKTLVAGLTPMIDTLPEGDDKRRNENLLLRYRARANNLTTKVENYGAIAKLEKELDRDEITADITVLDTLLAAVTARKAEL